MTGANMDIASWMYNAVTWHWRMSVAHAPSILTMSGIRPKWQTGRLAGGWMPTRLPMGRPAHRA